MFCTWLLFLTSQRLVINYWISLFLHPVNDTLEEEHCYPCFVSVTLVPTYYFCLLLHWYSSQLIQVRQGPHEVALKDILQRYFEDCMPISSSMDQCTSHTIIFVKLISSPCHQQTTDYCQEMHRLVSASQWPA